MLKTLQCVPPPKKKLHTTSKRLALISTNIFAHIKQACMDVIVLLLSPNCVRIHPAI